VIEALCIGHAAWDVSVWVPEYPVENSKCEVRTLVECSGGPAANAACLLAKWGVETAFAGAIGNDSAGDRIASSLAEFRVRLPLLHRFEDSPTPLSVILVNEQTGSRTIVNRSVGSTTRGAISLEAAHTWLPPKLLLFDGHELDASLKAMSLWPNAITLLDAGSLREGTRVLAEKVKCLAASERFVRQFTGVDPLDGPEAWERAIGALHDWNGNPVVITLGQRGLIAGTPESWFHLPAFLAKPVDTTGAGDIFHGALGFALLRNIPWSDSLRLASAAGALSVQKPGSSNSIPDNSEVETFAVTAAPQSQSHES